VLREAALLLAFEGWNDAGEAASSAARFIERSIRAVPLAEIEFKPVRTAEEGAVAIPPPWTFLLRREFDRKGIYPVTWEVQSSPQVLLQMESTIEDLTSWDSLPCRLSFG